MARVGVGGGDFLPLTPAGPENSVAPSESPNPQRAPTAGAEIRELLEGPATGDFGGLSSRTGQVQSGPEAGWWGTNFLPGIQSLLSKMERSRGFFQTVRGRGKADAPHPCPHTPARQAIGPHVGCGAGRPAASVVWEHFTCREGSVAMPVSRAAVLRVLTQPEALPAWGLPALPGGRVGVKGRGQETPATSTWKDHAHLFGLNRSRDPHTRSSTPPASRRRRTLKWDLMTGRTALPLTGIINEQTKESLPEPGSWSLAGWGWGRGREAK